MRSFLGRIEAFELRQLADKSQTLESQRYRHAAELLLTAFERVWSGEGRQGQERALARAVRAG